MPIVEGGVLVAECSDCGVCFTGLLHFNLPREAEISQQNSLPLHQYIIRFDITVNYVHFSALLQSSHSLFKHAFDEQFREKVILFLMVT